MTDGEKCSVCGTITVAQETIKLLPHTEQIVPGREATCKETGLTDGCVCSVCDAVITKQTEIPKSDVHTPKTVIGKAATCKEAGLSDGEICSVCDKILSAQVVIPMLDHTPEAVSKLNATCTSKGHTSGTRCSNCKTVLSGMSEIAQSKHRYINEKCYYCNDEYYSEGLVYELKSDGTYKITGRGSCPDVHLVFPMSYEGKDVTEIDFTTYSSWNGAPVVSISIPDTVATVTGLVPGRDLVGLTVGQNVQHLEIGYCYKLTEVYNFSSIDLSSMDKIKVIHTDKGEDSIMDYSSYTPYVFYTLDGANYLACYYADNTEITLPQGYYGQNYAIGDYAFYGTDVTSVNVPSTVTAIGNCAFYEVRSLASVEFEEGGLLTVGDRAFSNCTGLVEITLPESVTTIGNASFEFTSIKEFVVGKNVTSIGMKAFQNTSMTKLYISKSVKTIGMYIIDGTDGLTVYCEASSKPSGWDSSWNGGMLMNLTVLWGQTMPY